MVWTLIKRIRHERRYCSVNSHRVVFSNLDHCPTLDWFLQAGKVDLQLAILAIKKHTELLDILPQTWNLLQMFLVTWPYTRLIAQDDDYSPPASSMPGGPPWIIEVNRVRNSPGWPSECRFSCGKILYKLIGENRSPCLLTWKLCILCLWLFLLLVFCTVLSRSFSYSCHILTLALTHVHFSISSSSSFSTCSFDWLIWLSA